MRFSELENKEIINYSDGRKLGLVGNCDLSIDLETGQILEIIIPERIGLFQGVWGSEKTRSISWKSIKKIGEDTIIIDITQSD
ncbi:YlmC/YmxH family sporulation protein [Anaerobranca gottschalkii]|uniref:Sporulation protein, YlmC/YmxH family n=1 Tax=Anaerobranca gottschalkii DSM 13577 TaxID=1120990 RepID=A0A1H9Z9G1_9FIRM|nr:YlmC/YmxH family sporulation protein [Anaerobranca gottschalkii]SES77975.1 sporulation protein, YlmC/YmxH family [Anaerobranca gottschalkii DSM 13577]